LRVFLGQTWAVPDHSERKLATVLFADLVDSTAAAGEQDPERTRARLERFYDAMSAEIEGAGGTVEKFAGDAVMAAFGAPEALEDHAERALHTALAMQRRLEAVFGGELSLRIGVNTGEVVAGRPREGSSFVSGDAVNVAARLEQAAEPGEILAGERTVSAVRGAFEFDEPKTVEAKGKAGGVTCRPLVRALSLMRTRGVGGLARAFVGRDEQLDLLQSAYRRAVEGSHPVLVTIVGDPGVGKTRLVRELWEQLADQRAEPLRRTGRCLPYGQGITYWPLGEVLKEHLEILESDSPETVRRRLDEREILGLTLGLDVVGDLHPLAAQDRLHAAWIAFVSELTAERPLVLLIEDVHWAEQPLLDLIERIGRDAAGPLLLLTTARPDFVAGRTGWGARIDSETLWLEPLPAKTAGELVDSLLESVLSREVRELIVERAEGNPFFVEEVLESLIDAGVLERENGGWRANHLPPGFEIPDSVQAVLAARIDLLEEAEKTALQAAAVIGRVFWTGPVYELVEGLAPDLHLLETRDFIRQRPASSLAGEVEYAFKHALTREVAYGTLTKARRAQLHTQFAEWLERLGEGRDEHAPLLAHHYAEAVRPGDADVAWPEGGPELERARARAVLWLDRAAEAAMSRYELDDAVDLLHRALALVSERRETARLWLRIGRAHAFRYDGDGFMQAMQKALELSDDPVERADAYAELAFQSATRSGMWRRRPERDVMEDWTSRALAGVQQGGAAHVKALLARVYFGLPDADESTLLATELADRLGDVDLRSSAFDGRGWTAFRHGDFAAAHQWEMRRFDFIDKLTDPDLIHDLYLSTIPAAMALGRTDEARRLASENDELVARLTPHHRLHAVACTLEIEELVGNWDAIAALEQRTEEVVEANGDTPCIRNARSLLLCALANELLGRHDRSIELEAHAAELQNEGYGATLATPRARLALARGEFDQLHELLRDERWLQRQTWFTLPAGAARLVALAVVGASAEVEAAAAQIGTPGSYLEPFALRALGVVQGDETLLARAHERFRRFNLDWHADQTEALIRFRNTALG
jgi:class 3 adenylate cyclase/tetratricopeptide (TPR) repeat protein